MNTLTTIISGIADFHGMVLPISVVPHVVTQALYPELESRLLDGVSPLKRGEMRRTAFAVIEMWASGMIFNDLPRALLRLIVGR